MKFACNVQVGNRLLPSLHLSSNKIFLKSTLALCKSPKSDKFCLILFNANHKSGTKYNVSGNISLVLTKFIKEGKATIQFKEPPHDLYIQGDVIQLKGFLHLLKRALENKIEPNELTYSSLSVTPIAKKDLAPKKLIINSRADYPAQGFPRTLEVLKIVDIGRSSLDRGILTLVKLKELSLSRNGLEKLPSEFSNLPNLSFLDLSFNQLWKSLPKEWCWLEGKLAKSLNTLILSSNLLRFLPNQIVKMSNLKTLNIQQNHIKKLPSGIGNLRQLRDFNASSNKLADLPGTVQNWQLQTLDLTFNDFKLNRELPPVDIPNAVLPILTMKDYAARKVLGLRLHYDSSIVPRTVVEYLDYAKYCICGRATFNVYIKFTQTLALNSISDMVKFDDFASYVNTELYLCSLQCCRSAMHNRRRMPVTSFTLLTSYLRLMDGFP